MPTNEHHYSRIQLDAEDIQLGFKHLPSLLLSQKDYPVENLARNSATGSIVPPGLAKDIHKALTPLLQFVKDPKARKEIDAALLERQDPWALALVYPENLYPELLKEVTAKKQENAKWLASPLAIAIADSLRLLGEVRESLFEWARALPAEGDERTTALLYILYCVSEGERERCLKGFCDLVTGSQFLRRPFKEYCHQ